MPAPIKNNVSAFLHPFSHMPTLAESGPVVIDHGRGIYVFDEQGRKYLEGNSGLWNVVLGFDNPALVAAAREAYAKLPAYHAFFGRVARAGLDLAQRLVDMAPMPADRVFFANSGSEANDSVVKMLWLMAEAEGQPQRKTILTRWNSYHGTTVMTASLTGKAYNQAFGLPLAQVKYVMNPHHWREGRPGESELEFSARCAADLEARITELGADTIAGFFAEPVMGAGGVVPPPEGYFQAIQPVLRRHGIPLVADEVICGFGRTGERWGSITYGMTPDIVVASKVITAGFFPMGAVILSPEITARVEAASAKYDEFPHGFTTGAHPVGCAIAMAVLDQIEQGGILKHIQAVSPLFQRRLKALADHPMVGEARGIGLMGALEIVADKPTKQAFPGQWDVSEKIAGVALKHGLIVRPLGSAVVLAPPFIITEAEIDELFSILERTLDEVHASVMKLAA
ncbi:adenosylmethionine-8-amino-7-oxononanoate aminotransferase [Rhodoligotrophos appendicifer]|uniref:aminotransferase n=1 Tax=Rhodoligotrophos appendicifer TaxID=987056 RepID=UPI001184F327|nr:aminotransferase [Rhodoligotrophos appendicifer]